MKIVAITSYPPNTLPLSSFGYQAIQRFSEDSDIEQIIVLADAGIYTSESDPKSRIVVERCWRFNSAFNIVRILRKIAQHKPNIIWLNLQYTYLGNKSLPAFLGLMIPLCLRLFRFNTVILLHNYLEVTDLDKVGFKRTNLLNKIMRVADRIIMRSILSANTIFVMEKSYYYHLRQKYPKRNVQFIEQDLYKPLPFYPVDDFLNQIVTMGYFGTYKKLEILLDAFETVRNEIPNAQLKIVGKSHTHTPKYLETILAKYSNSNRLDNVEFLGYVSDEKVSSHFWNSKIVTVTNSTVTGSSGVLWYAARHGRGIITPYVDLYQPLQKQGWGILYYEPENATSLANAIISVLKSPNLTATLANANYHKVFDSNDQFASSHLIVFRELVQDQH